MLDFSRVVGFDWDDGNRAKNQAHAVENREAEQLFFNAPLKVTPDESHSVSEPRFRALGQTDEGRQLTVIFTLRAEGTLIRVISARDMHRKERALHEQAP
jgi:uncharacterized DUF497 family protein